MPYLLLFCLILFLPQGSGAEALVINAVGDIMLAGSGAPFFKKRGYDYPFAGTASVLRQGDIVTGNLEAPIAILGEEFAGKKYRFKTDPAAALALKNAGFTHLSLANNHILDFGAPALQETREFLDSHGILFSGAGANLSVARKESVVTVKNRKIAFLSYSLIYPAEFFATGKRPGAAPGYTGYITEDIIRAKNLADLVIVSFHWGEESSATPKDYQKVVAHWAVDAGADIILGHHPHVLQGIEYYKKGIIFYSLGNFTFASKSKHADRSIIARITVDDGIQTVEIIPLNVANSEVSYQPKLLGGEAAVKVAVGLDSLSRLLGTRIEQADGRFFAKPAGAALSGNLSAVQISRR